MRSTLILAALVVGIAAPAQAQNFTTSSFGLQNFRPAIDSKGYITVNASQILGHLDFSIGLIGSYQREPLVLKLDDGTGRRLPRRPRGRVLARRARRRCQLASRSPLRACDVARSCELAHGGLEQGRRAR